MKMLLTYQIQWLEFCEKKNSFRCAIVINWHRPSAIWVDSRYMADIGWMWHVVGEQCTFLFYIYIIPYRIRCVSVRSRNLDDIRRSIRYPSVCICSTQTPPNQSARDSSPTPGRSSNRSLRRQQTAQLPFPRTNLHLVHSLCTRRGTRDRRCRWARRNERMTRWMSSARGHIFPFQFSNSQRWIATLGMSDF